MKILGIDEAGRGPVIGPLVMAGVIIKPEQEDNLRNMGVKDSKDLSELQRERMFDEIKDNYEHKIIIIPPTEVDEAVLSEKSNLNWLEADHSIEIINSLNPDKAILDCPSTNIQAFTDYVKNKVKSKTEILAEHKADSIYPVVSAASILAKVTRDREIEKLKEKIKINFGSGYPSDPRTQQFLKEHFKDYDFFRKSWASYQKIAKDKGQSKLGEF